MADRKKEQVIVLLGDLSSHRMIERGSGKNSKDAPSYQIRSKTNDKPLLPEMIAHALEDGWPEFKAEMIIIDRDARGMCDTRFSILDRFPQSSSRKDGLKVLRVREDYIVSEERKPDETTTNENKWSGLVNNIQQIKKKIVELDNENQHRITVIYDQHGCTRQAFEQLAGKSDRLEELQYIFATNDLVLGINSDAEKWANTLSKLAGRKLFKSKPQKTGVRRITIVTTADTLRKAGVNIKKYGALEHSIMDILAAKNQSQAKDQSPVSTFLEYADNLVIVFRETGSLHIRKVSEGRCEATLHYCPNFDRIAQSDARGYGRVPGKFAIYLSAVIKGLYTIADEKEASIGMTPSPPDQKIFDGALRLAAVAFNRHFKNGLGYKNPFESIEKALADPDGEMANACENTASREYLTCSLHLSPDQVDSPAGWSRTSKFLARDGVNEELRRIVIEGMDTVLSAPLSTPSKKSKIHRLDDKPWFPRSFIAFPYATFGQLKLLDTEEIAEHFELAKIIGKYIETADWRTPLSIAVFGKPGSGKSFAVNQVLKSVDPSRKSDPLTFNLAQFSTVDQLTEAFHQIQDRALASEEVPLAVFDEFDAFCNENERGWLKYFLAPMQDGLFRGKSGDYRVGRAIFLFSGGTSESFEQFAKPASSNVKKDEAKLRDFLSRLRGYLNVSDINVNRSGASQHLITLRRAALLRTLLQIHAKPIMVEYSDGTVQARIHEEVIDAFLRADYVHGVRSMEAIIQMSNWVDGNFVPASLPSKDQLMVHVTNGKFLRNESSGQACSS